MNRVKRWRAGEEKGDGLINQLQGSGGVSPNVSSAFLMHVAYLL